MSKRRFTNKPTIAPDEVLALSPTHPAMVENRTLFPSTVVTVTESEPARLLVSGQNNRKLGSHVEKGTLKGAALYGLSLEERATCPVTCDVRARCYGNGMQMARRHRIGDQEVFYARLEAELGALIAEHGTILVRLHVLGDFPTEEYVAFWKDMLDEMPGLSIYGYSHRLPKHDPVGDAIQAVKDAHPDRFRIRWSTQAPMLDAASIRGSGMKAEGLRCPAQSDATACCATCGLCWEPSARGKTILFDMHGRRTNGNAAKAANASGDLTEEEVDELHQQVAEADERADEISWVPTDWGLEPAQKRFLAAMMGRRILTRESAMIQLYGDRADGGPDPKSLDVQLTHIRRKLAGKVVIHTEWGQGWRLDPESAHLLDCLRRGVPVQAFDLASALSSENADAPKLRPIVPMTLPPKMMPAELSEDRPDVRMIRPVDMRVEESYQRSLTGRSVSLIRQIVAGWDWRKFKPPIVVEHGSLYLVIDGQHTAIAAASHPGIFAIPCLVVKAETIAERATSFLSHNTDRVVMSAVALFHASVAAGDEKCAAVARILTANGAFVPRYIVRKSDAAVGEFVGVRKAVDAFGVLGADKFARLVRIAVKSRVAPVATALVSALKVILSEDEFADIAALDDAAIAAALHSINDFERAAITAAAARKETNRYRGGAYALAHACRSRQSLDASITELRSTACVMAKRLSA